MKLKILEDNNTFIDMYYLAEPGVSYYIEDGNEKILFDTGYSSVILKNAKKMNIDLNTISKLVISHGHDDHTGGLKYFFEEKRTIELIAYPECFDYKEDPTGLYIGSPLSKKELSRICRLNLSKEPVQISEHITYLGEIPILNDFEQRYSIGKRIVNGEKIDDTIIDDSAIVYKNEKGLFIITGCSHSGICNIIEYAKKVCNDDRIYGVIGGFHLFDVNKRLEKTIDYLKENNIKLLYPCHCVSLKAKLEMAKRLDINEVGVGLELNV
ncbi:MAG: MBL fold metallo-hydrolase [Bacilli bacterium]|nr:MBL fold metallo-hydrolase [Bacilli bacterium]